MRLTELEPKYMKVERRPETWVVRNSEGEPEEQVEGLRTYYVVVETKEEADGIELLCPVCFKQNNGPIGTHMILCWRPKMPLTDYLTGPGRWELVGNDFNDMSLVGNPTSSVQLHGGCNAHFSVVNGEIVWH